MKSANTSATDAPHGSIETILSASPHCACGPMRSVGAVSVRSARWPRVRLPAATASARYTPYEPEWVPMTLRCPRLAVVPTTGPRAAAVGAPQRIGGAPLGPWPGWDVRRMCFAPDGPGVSEVMHCFHEPEGSIGLQAQAHVHVVVQHPVDADRRRFTAVRHEAQRFVQRDGRGVGRIRGEVELADAVGFAGVRDHRLQQAASEAAAAVRLGDEDAPHEALVLQLAHLLAVPGG